MRRHLQPGDRPIALPSAKCTEHQRRVVGALIKTHRSTSSRSLLDGLAGIPLFEKSYCLLTAMGFLLGVMKMY